MRAHVAMLATAMVIVRAGTAYAETVTMNVIDASGVGKVIGTISLSDANEGLVVMPDLADLPPGDHGFHVHVNPNCGPGAGPDGQPAAGFAAGGHYDPTNTGKHLGPRGEGHKGDLICRQRQTGITRLPKCRAAEMLRISAGLRPALSIWRAGRSGLRLSRRNADRDRRPAKRRWSHPGRFRQSTRRPG